MSAPDASAAQATELIVIRHGETWWNRERRMQGQTDSQLSDLGAEQARAVGRRLVGERFDALYASDLARARDTARAVAEATGHELRIDARLRERGFGILEGLLREEMEHQHPGEYAVYRARDPDRAVTGGESARAFYARSMAVFEDLVRRHAGGRIVVVTHGLLLDSLYRASHGLDLNAKRTLELINASLNTFRRHAAGWEMLRWGDTAHLDTVTVYRGMA